MPAETPQSQVEHEFGSYGQSLGQLHSSSPASHVTLPQTGGHTPQSAAQLEHVSPASHVASPQTGGQAPQSAAHVEQSSPVSHEALPQTGPLPLDELEVLVAVEPAELVDTVVEVCGLPLAWLPEAADEAFPLACDPPAPSPSESFDDSRVSPWAQPQSPKQSAPTSVARSSRPSSAAEPVTMPRWYRLAMREINDAAELARVLDAGEPLAEVVIRGLDLRTGAAPLIERSLEGTVLLGCLLEPHDLARAVIAGALVFPPLPQLPYQPWRASLYTPEELFAGFDPADPCTYCDTLDARVYRHFLAKGGADEAPMLEAFAQRLHDHGIMEALEAMLRAHPRVVAFMGGHGLSRAEPTYLAVARMAGELAARGFVVATGGGPGAMEAANLGARFAGRDDAALARAVAALAEAPRYDHGEWLAKAFRVRREHAALLEEPPVPTLGIPTFFYGHEPPNAFATQHAKYFANCIREDGLVSLATHGIVYAPGSAGTVQEIFQDACQNHYGTVHGMVSPMALFGVQYWTDALPVMPLLQALSAAGWQDRVVVSDDPAVIVEFLVGHGPRALDRNAWSFCHAFCAS